MVGLEGYFPDHRYEAELAVPYFAQGQADFESVRSQELLQSQGLSPVLRQYSSEEIDSSALLYYPAVQLVLEYRAH